MLEPSQFDVDEAWIIFRLNDAPISTEVDGDFNVLCLMDAASCYILGNEFVPAHLALLPDSTAARLIEEGRSQAHVLPRKFFISKALESEQFVHLAKQLGVQASRVADDELSSFTSEAKEGFRAHVRGPRMH